MNTLVDSSIWFATPSARDRNNELAQYYLLILDEWTVLLDSWQLLRLGAAGLVPSPAKQRS
ncbi:MULTISPECIES: hypothetical protein [Bradyrhizobium]|uniref:hypothetical protein n=1 Tax=Bradyrhizobium elkanii TaxID=29448 RepID=UPI0003FDDB09|nr:hypothetical protein [Bradyrhizobium elkanii]